MVTPASRNLLMIAYHFPPVRVSSGIQRTLKFALYLREHGWQPQILTVAPRAYEITSSDQLQEVPSDMVVRRAFCLDTARHLSVKGRYLGRLAEPDRWASWLPDGILQGLRLVRSHRPAAIFSTYPIATAHLLGLRLQRLTGLPWVADFRDLMTEEGYPTQPRTWRIYRRLEQRVITRCSRAIFTTPGAQQMYIERYPQIDSNRFCVIENGFDELNFANAEADLSPQPLGEPGQRVLLHAGILYPSERDPRPFFQALGQLKGSGEISAKTLKIVLRASGSDELYRPMLKERGIDDIVELASTVGYETALQEMLRADGLLLFQAANCNNQIPAKLYEYLRAGRPIFTLTDPAGNTAEALRGAGATAIVDISDAEAIAAGLRRFLNGLEERSVQGIPRAVADRHSRRARTAELAAVLDQAVASP